MLRFLFSCALLAVLCHSQQCAVNLNTNSSAEDMAPARFVVSQGDCCAACVATEGCVAAVFANYYCHLKGEIVDSNEAAGVTLLTVSSTATVGPTSTPTTSAPTTTTAVPATPAPIVPTPQPTPQQYVTIIREVQCRYSSHCNQSNDNQCYQTVYYNNTCQKKHKEVCGTYHISVEKYSEDGCGGVVTSTSKEDINVCQSVDYEYYGHYCDVQKAPTSGIAMVRTTCPYGCASGGECSASKFSTGVCRSNPFGSLSGASVIAWCFPEYVVFSAYGSIDCSGPIEDSRAEPLGCWNEAYTYVENVCG